MNPAEEIKLKDIKKTISDILLLRTDFAKIGQPIPSNIPGSYGELKVWEKLKRKFEPNEYKVKLRSGHSKADISLSKGNEVINIEVKTSRLKSEGPGRLYGFPINIKKCKLHPKRTYNHPKKGKIEGDFCYLDNLVAVTLSGGWKYPKFYIFSRKFLEDNEKSIRNRSKRFSSNSHRIIFLDKELKNSEEITRVDRWISKNKSRYQNDWPSIGV